MPSNGSARRYAQAVFEIAQEHDSYDQWLRDLQALADVFGISEVQAFLEGPRVPLEDKEKILDQHLQSLSPLAQNLARILVKKRRVQLATGILDSYLVMLDEQRGVVEATVTSAVPLDPQLQEEIERVLQAQVGKQMRLSTQVDPEIIGGLVARVGDKVIDGSTRTRLKNLRDWLREGAAS